MTFCLRGGLEKSESNVKSQWDILKKSTKFSISLLQIILQFSGLKHLQICQSKSIDITILILC